MKNNNDNDNNNELKTRYGSKKKFKVVEHHSCGVLVFILVYWLSW